MKIKTKMSPWIKLGFLVILAGSFCSVSTGAESDPTLIGYWSFDEGKGEVAKDSSANHQDGKVKGAKWVKGKKGFGLKFDGIDDFVDCGKFKLPSSFTMAAWVKVEGKNIHPQTQKPAPQFFISKGFTTGLHTTAGYPTSCYRLRLAGVIPEYAAQTTGYDVTKWHHIVGVYSQNQAKIYVDGILAKSEVVKGNLKYDDPAPYLQNLHLGSAHPFYPFCGILDEVKIWNRELSEEEIKNEAGLPESVFVSLTSKLIARIIDEDTSKPLNAKVFIKGGDGNYYWPENSFHYGKKNKKAQFYCFDGEFEVNLPQGKTKLTILRGFEYEAKKLTLDLKDKETKNIKIKLKRFVNLSSLGWYGGDHQVQYLGHGKGEYDERFTPYSASKICEGEGLNFAVFTNPAVGVLTDTWERTLRYTVLVELDNFISYPGFEPRDVVSGAISGFGVKKYPKWGLDRQNQKGYSQIS